MLNFDDVLKQSTQAYKEAEAFDDWMPPDGEYTAVVTSYGEGVVAKETDTFAWMKLQGKLLTENDPELDGREFSLGYFTTKALGILKGAVAKLGGSKLECDDLKLASELLKRSVGTIVNIKVATTVNKKNHQEYKNVRILGVIGGQDTGQVPTA
jgi:hypothetical protein